MVIITYYIIDDNNNFVSVHLIKMYYSLGIELINFEVHALMIIKRYTYTQHKRVL